MNLLKLIHIYISAVLILSVINPFSNLASDSIAPVTKQYYQIALVNPDGIASDGSMHKLDSDNPPDVPSYGTLEDPDVTAPQISGVGIVSSTETTVTMGFNTDEPGTTIIKYSLSSGEWNDYEHLQSDGVLVTDHLITLDVSPLVYYYLRASSVDAAGNDHTTDPLDNNPSDEYILYYDVPPPDVVNPESTESNDDPPIGAAEATCFIDTLFEHVE